MTDADKLVDILNNHIRAEERLRKDRQDQARALDELVNVIKELRGKLAAAEADTKRLDWLMRQVRGSELRRIGVVYVDGSIEYFRAAIDAARGEKG